MPSDVFTPSLGSIMQRKGDAQGLMARTEKRRTDTSSAIADKQRASFGQFFTPEVVAAHLASLFDFPKEGTWRLLDPGAGVGILSAAVIAEAIRRGFRGSVDVTACELDNELIPHLVETLEDCVETSLRAGITLTTTVVCGDFLEWVSSQDQFGGPEILGFDKVVMNPPYKKVQSISRARKLTEHAGCGSPNLYTSFVTMALRVMNDGAQMVAITPRSFANGPYFLPFRRDLLSRCSLKHIHLYGSRNSAFSDTDVLQENIMWRADVAVERGLVLVSQSYSQDHDVASRTVKHSVIVDDNDVNLFLHLPLDEDDDAIAARMSAMPETLKTLGLTVSTGMVVDFRSRHLLQTQPGPATVPMVYPAHFVNGISRWPEGANKASYFDGSGDQSQKAMLPEGWFVVIKRFSAKEEDRRVVAGLWNPTKHPGPVAFDNKTNVVHCDKVGLDPELARGVAGYINTRFFDNAFRQFSGHTQVNATDLRSLRFPARDVLVRMGRFIGDEAPWGNELDTLLARSEK